MVLSCQNAIWLNGSFVYFHSPDALPGATTLDNYDSLFALVMTPGFYRHYVEVKDQDPACGSLYAYDED